MEILFVHEFIDYPNAKNIDNGWWEYDSETNKCLNLYGGYHILHEHPLNEFKESTWDKIMYDKYMNERYKYRTGWLAPNGEFYGCDYRDHKDCAEWLFDCSERDLEEKGYSKIYRSVFDSSYQFDLYPNNHYLTNAQWKYLLDNEYITPEEYNKWRI